MKKLSIICLALLTLVVSSAAARADVRDEVVAFLQQYNAAYESGDLTALLAATSDDPGVSSIGSGPGEFFRGRQAIDQSIRQTLADVKGVSLKFQDIEVSSRGEVAWLAATCFVQTETKDGRVIRAPARFSAVLLRENGQWKFHQTHMSVASNQLPYYPAGKK